MLRPTTSLPLRWLLFIWNWVYGMFKFHDLVDECIVVLSFQTWFSKIGNMNRFIFLGVHIPLYHTVLGKIRIYVYMRKRIFTLMVRTLSILYRQVGPLSNQSKNPYQHFYFWYRYFLSTDSSFIKSSKGMLTTITTTTTTTK